MFNDIIFFLPMFLTLHFGFSNFFKIKSLIFPDVILKLAAPQNWGCLRCAYSVRRATPNQTALFYSAA